MSAKSRPRLPPSKNTKLQPRTPAPHETKKNDRLDLRRHPEGWSPRKLGGWRGSLVVL